MNATTTIDAHDMTYTIIRTDHGFDVRDVSGSRPLGLRASGPWQTEEAAIAAVRAMTREEAAE